MRELREGGHIGLGVFMDEEGSGHFVSCGRHSWIKYKPHVFCTWLWECHKEFMKFPKLEIHRFLFLKNSQNSLDCLKNSGSCSP